MHCPQILVSLRENGNLRILASLFKEVTVFKERTWWVAHLKFSFSPDIFNPGERF